jgi:SSS family solute:Na+ symporter
MTPQVSVVIGMTVGYLLLIVLIGWYSSRFSRKTMEDFHMGGREFGSLVLFSSVFGANISAVTFIGIPGMAYHVGWIAWPYFVTAWGWLTPLLFLLLGLRAWRLGQRFGYMTIGEIVGGRWRSPLVTVLVSLILILYTIPYLMTGLRGAGVTIEVVTDGYLPFSVGAFAVSLVMVIYLTMGGMRASAWVNTFQTFVFLGGAVVVFLMIARVLGGPAEATNRVLGDYPQLISRQGMPWKQFVSYGVIVALAVPMFPQVFMRILTGKDPGTLRNIVKIYPLASLIVFFLMAYIGMWGRAAVPGLVGAESDSILPRLLRAYTPLWMMGILVASVFAAMMSTMDAQLLAVTTIITREFLPRTRLSMATEATLVRVSKGFVIVLTAMAFVLALMNPIGIIRIVEFAFAGFACLMPVSVAALYWKRCTRQAAIAAIVLPQLLLVALTFGWIDRGMAFGFLPGLPAVIVATLTLIAVTYVTRPSREDATATYFAPFERRAGRSTSGEASSICA